MILLTVSAARPCYGECVDSKTQAGRPPWDPYAVWQVLLHRHPVRVQDPSGSCGRIERETLAEFCEAISEYPDFLQDALLVIAHAEGFTSAITALDDAVREHLARRQRRLPVALAPRDLQLARRS